MVAVVEEWLNSEKVEDRQKKFGWVITEASAVSGEYIHSNAGWALALFIGPIFLARGVILALGIHIQILVIATTIRTNSYYGSQDGRGRILGQSLYRMFVKLA